MTFDNGIDCEYCYDYYIYNYGKTWQIPVFKLYKIIIKLGMIYANITKYSNLLLSSKC